MTTLGAPKNGCLKEGNCYDVTARLVCTINKLNFCARSGNGFLTIIRDHAGWMLTANENKRICQISSLKSPRGRLRNFSSGGGFTREFLKRYLTEKQNDYLQSGCL